MSETQRKWTKRIGVALLLAFVGWLASSFAVLHRLRSREKPRFTEHPPAKWNGRCETLSLRSGDGEELGAWFVDAARDSAPSILLLHGRGGSRSSRVGAAEVFLDAGCSVLLVTLRAHGDSSGEREDFGWSARRDVIAAVDWLEARRPGSRVVVCGASLGGAAAIFAGAELGERVDAYVFECVYADLDSAARRRFEMQLPSPLDAIAHVGLRTAAHFAWPEWRRIAPREHIASLHHDARVLILAGADDRHAPLEDARTLLAPISDRAQLIVIENAEHDRLLHANPAAYTSAIRGFLGEFERR